MFLHKMKRSFHIRCRQVSFRICRVRFSIHSLMSKCSIPWSLSLSHAVLACKSKIWWLIHHSCLALLLIAFLALWGEAKNTDLPWMGRQHRSDGVCEQPTVGCSWQEQLLTGDNIVEHLSHEEMLREVRGWEIQPGEHLGQPHCSLPVPEGSPQEWWRRTSYNSL